MIKKKNQQVAWLVGASSQYEISPLSGHTQEATDECARKWSNGLLSLSLPLSLSPPHCLSLSKINKFKKFNFKKRLKSRSILAYILPTPASKRHLLPWPGGLPITLGAASAHHLAQSNKCLHLYFSKKLSCLMNALYKCIFLTNMRPNW